MKTPLWGALVAVSSITFASCAATRVRIPGKNVCSEPLYHTKVSDYLSSKVHSPIGADIFYQRSTDGSKLFITFRSRKGNEAAYRTLIVTGDGIRDISGYPNVWYGDHGDPVFRLEGGKEWYEDEGTSYRFFSRWEDSSYVFKGGAVIPYRALKSVSSVRGIVGGHLVLVRLRDKPAWIVAAPEHPERARIELPKGFEPQAAYASGNDVIMFDTYRPQGDEFVRRCLIYQKSGDGYGLGKEIPIPWMSGVFDCWPETGVTLIEALNTRHMYPTYYRFDIRTQRRAYLGLVPADEVLFLREDVVRTLDTALGESK